MAARTDRADTPATRLDRAVALRADDAIRTPEGYLRVPVRIAKPGVMVYMEGGRAVREFVPASTLSDPAWLSSLEGKPITYEHPEAEVNPENIRDLQVGTLLPPVRFEGGYVVGDAMITHAEGLRAVGAGTAEVSPAYGVDLDNTPGTDPAFGPYDRVQTRRYAGNHLALTDRARGGRDIRLQMRADAIEADPAAPAATPATESPVKISAALLPILAALALDPAAFADDAAATAAISAKIAEMKAPPTVEVMEDAAMESAPAAVEMVAEAGPEMPADTYAKMDSARKSKRAAAQTRTFDALLKVGAERVRLDAEAKALEITGTEKMGARALRRAIVAKLNPAVRADASDEYVAAALDLARQDGRFTTTRADAADPYAPLAALAAPAAEKRADADPNAGKGAAERGARHYGATSATV